MRVIEDGRAVQHLGPPGKSTSIALTGFSAGRSVWRINPSGLVSGQWVTLGVLLKRNQLRRYAQDTVIFSAVLPQPDDDDDNSNSEKQSITSISKFELSNDDIVVIVLDANQCVVEYYKSRNALKRPCCSFQGPVRKRRTMPGAWRSTIEAMAFSLVLGDGNGAGDLQKRSSGPKQTKLRGSEKLSGSLLCPSTRPDRRRDSCLRSVSLEMNFKLAQAVCVF